ncbi:MAG: NAD-dependent epimerase/dehydratase family protein [bacterium]
MLVDNLSNSKRSVLEHINSLTPKPLTFYHCDIGDQEALSKIFASHSLDAVIHFAAYKAVGESCEKPFVYYKNNIEGSLALFELMDRYNVKHIIFSSSATVYDQTCIPPFLETDRLGTTNPYATTKLVIEHLLHDLALHK